MVVVALLLADDPRHCPRLRYQRWLVRISAKAMTCSDDRLAVHGQGRPGPALGLASWAGVRPSAGPMRGGEIPGSWPESVAILYRIWLGGIKNPEFGLAGPPAGAFGCHHQRTGRCFSESLQLGLLHTSGAPSGTGSVPHGHSRAGSVTRRAARRLDRRVELGTPL